jgi:hypothetical protein
MDGRDQFLDLLFADLAVAAGDLDAALQLFAVKRLDLAVAFANGQIAHLNTLDRSELGAALVADAPAANNRVFGVRTGVLYLAVGRIAIRASHNSRMVLILIWRVKWKVGPRKNAHFYKKQDNYLLQPFAPKLFLAPVL